MFLSSEQAKIRLEYLEKRLAKLPKGKVTKRKQHSYAYPVVWINDFPNHQEYANKYFSIKRSPGNKLLPLVEESCSIGHEIEEILSRLRSAGCEVRIVSSIKRRNEPVKMDRKYFEELKKTADSNPMEKINPIEHNGILMRSKGEALIATKLDELGLEYTYESRVNIGRDVYPDFSVYIPEIDKVFFIEFMGGMSDQKYRFNGDFKFSEYAGYGFMNGRDIIFICENDGDKADVELLEAQINALIMANTEVKRE